ncbi:Oidioi.mRNA.OKI2018_I69.XSR.g13694.t2.cds [Oikopleura dioica]|uniref:Oidioi.mRNA.OKI2018_I69.XSR.g13694.t2.cds n=1 Tax=Oikopleura dioica TaxID=34765 RepID=A0ABN7SBD2_OIKDI|nr:Oidioi.mRNA.OKI2018_I69.XSR.g13694.t2.cds [Oikopleura dioica]
MRRHIREEHAERVPLASVAQGIFFNENIIYLEGNESAISQVQKSAPTEEVPKNVQFAKPSGLRKSTRTVSTGDEPMTKDLGARKKTVDKDTMIQCKICTFVAPIVTGRGQRPEIYEANVRRHIREVHAKLLPRSNKDIGIFLSKNIRYLRGDGAAHAAPAILSQIKKEPEITIEELSPEESYPEEFSEEEEDEDAERRMSAMDTENWEENKENMSEESRARENHCEETERTNEGSAKEQQKEKEQAAENKEEESEEERLREMSRQVDIFSGYMIQLPQERVGNEKIDKKHLGKYGDYSRLIPLENQQGTFEECPREMFVLPDSSRKWKPVNLCDEEIGETKCFRYLTPHGNISDPYYGRLVYLHDTPFTKRTVRDAEVPDNELFWYLFATNMIQTCQKKST